MRELKKTVIGILLVLILLQLCSCADITKVQEDEGDHPTENDLNFNDLYRGQVVKASDEEGFFFSRLDGMRGIYYFHPESLSLTKVLHDHWIDGKNLEWQGGNTSQGSHISIQSSEVFLWEDRLYFLVKETGEDFQVGISVFSTEKDGSNLKKVAGGLPSMYHWFFLHRGKLHLLSSDDGVNWNTIHYIDLATGEKSEHKPEKVGGPYFPFKNGYLYIDRPVYRSIEDENGSLYFIQEEKTIDYGVETSVVYANDDMILLSPYDPDSEYNFPVDIFNHETKKSQRLAPYFGNCYFYGQDIIFTSIGLVGLPEDIQRRVTIFNPEGEELRSFNLPAGDISKVESLGLYKDYLIFIDHSNKEGDPKIFMLNLETGEISSQKNE